jgi:hypothetical protein
VSEAEHCTLKDRPARWVSVLLDGPMFSIPIFLVFGWVEAGAVSAASQKGSISGVNHLSVLVNAHETIGPWISSLLQAKQV